MISKHLRVKIIGGALILVLMVSLLSTIVVSIIVSRQNKSAVTASLEKGLTIARDDLLEVRGNITSDLGQMVEINQIGEQIKFILEFGDKGANIAKNSYLEIANAAFERTVSNRYNQVIVYNLDGNLIGFAARTEGGGYLKGYHSGGTLTYKELEEAVDSDELKWIEATGADNRFPESRYADPVPSQATAFFVTSDTHLMVRAVIPISGRVFNEALNEYEAKQNGFVVADKVFDHEFISKISRLTGMKAQIFAKKALSVGDLKAYGTLSTDQIEKKAGKSLTLQEIDFMFNTINIADDKYFQGILPFYEKENFVGAVALLESDRIVAANTRQMVFMLCLVALGCMVLSVPMAFFVAGKMVKPISEIVHRLKDMAQGEGDLTKRLDVRSKDEIGQVASWFNVFIEKIHEMIKDISGNTSQLHTVSEDLAGISKVMDSGSDQTATKTNMVEAAINQMSTDMSSVADAMGEASNNINMVAASTEQMSMTINEISNNAVKAREITKDAVVQSEAASEQVGELDGAAADIGKVVETINDISEQVNLLSLNATIEAARAGDAGKGFAVVANEIKELAGQTAAATNDIKEKVNGIRITTDKTVRQINNIASVVNNVNEIVGTITTAVEEQSSTTNNITENVGQVSQGIEAVTEKVSQSSEASRKIAQDIGDLTVTADEMSQNSTVINERSVELSQLSSRLGQMVGSFKI